MTVEPYRASQFRGGYVAEFLPPGQRTWRMLKADGEPKLFPSWKAARDAAYSAFMLRLEPNIRSTMPVDPERLKSNLEAQAEDWLRSKREDVRRSEIIRVPGKRPLLKVPGKARG